jgi:hypothetical protein
MANQWRKFEQWGRDHDKRDGIDRAEVELEVTITEGPDGERATENLLSQVRFKQIDGPPDGPVELLIISARWAEDHRPFTGAEKLAFYSDIEATLEQEILTAFEYDYAPFQDIPY